METTWRTTASGETLFMPRTPLQARLIIGAMLSLFALFFGYHLVAGAFEYLRVATPGEWLDALPGLLVILILFLLFASPAWAALVGRTYVTVNASHGSIAEVFDLRIYRRTRNHPVEQVTAVRVGVRTLRTKGHSSASYAVEIVLRTGRAITVTHEERPEDAREVAEQVARSFGGFRIPLENAV